MTKTLLLGLPPGRLAAAARLFVVILLSQQLVVKSAESDTGLRGDLSPQECASYPLPEASIDRLYVLDEPLIQASNCSYIFLTNRNAHTQVLWLGAAGISGLEGVALPGETGTRELGYNSMAAVKWFVDNASRQSPLFRK